MMIGYDDDIFDPLNSGHLFGGKEEKQEEIKHKECSFLVDYKQICGNKIAEHEKYCTAHKYLRCKKCNAFAVRFCDKLPSCKTPLCHGCEDGKHNFWDIEL